MQEHMNDLRIISCHLGNGASIAAIKYGKSIDTSMGYTPLEGLIMGTRSGEIDPAIIPFLMEKENMNAQQIDDYLNRRSGILGISGLSSDFRDLESAANRGDDRSQLAIDVFAYKVKKYIGGYVAAMGGVDAIVFTAGLGENSPLCVIKSATAWNISVRALIRPQPGTRQRARNQRTPCACKNFCYPDKRGTGYCPRYI